MASKKEFATVVAYFNGHDYVELCAGESYFQVKISETLAPSVWQHIRGRHTTIYREIKFYNPRYAILVEAARAHIAAQKAA